MPRAPVNSAVNVNMRPKELLHTDDVKIEQKLPIVGDAEEREPEIVKADEAVLKKEYADALTFNEDPITIRIEPSSEKNASAVYPVWCNGKGAEVFINGRWREVTWLPVNTDLIVKRKYVAIMMSAKIDRVETHIIKRMEDEENRVNRFTSPVCTFSVIHDPDPRGPDYFRGIRARNM